MVVPVADNAFATDSVEGQRARPSRVMRFDLLKVVGSSPDFLASPDGESPARVASRSRAVQILAWVNMAGPPPEGETGEAGIFSKIWNIDLGRPANYMVIFYNYQ